MEKNQIITLIFIIIAVVVAAVAIFHVVHHRLYCRYRKVPGKSHCSVCGHRQVCKKYHYKND